MLTVLCDVLLTISVICPNPMDCEKKVSPPTEAEIRAWVRQLGARRYADREAAEKKLRRAGLVAVVALAEGARSGDAEIVTRTVALLKKLRSEQETEGRQDSIRQLIRLARSSNETASTWAIGVLRYQWIFLGSRDACGAIRSLSKSETPRIADRSNEARVLSIREENIEDLRTHILDYEVKKRQHQSTRRILGLIHTIQEAMMGASSETTAQQILRVDRLIIVMDDIQARWKAQLKLELRMWAILGR